MAESDLLRIARQAMATTFEIVLPIGTPHALKLGHRALDEIERIEDQLTVYRDTSEVSRLNRTAAEAPVPVESGLFELLQLSARIHRDTQGAFDITAGALVRAWGFLRGPRRVPEPSELAEALANVGMKFAVLDETTRSVRFLRRGLEINLGSIGKGYALDRAATVLRDAGVTSAILHGGQSSVLAIGAPPHDRSGWPVGISHPRHEQHGPHTCATQAERLAVVHLRNQALGTSAATFQYLAHEGKKLGHLLDPRTGWPAEGIASASAIASSAAEADALATAFFILGVDRTRAHSELHPGVGAILLPDGSDKLTRLLPHQPRAQTRDT